MSANAILGGGGVPAVLIRGRRYPILLPKLSDPRLHLAAVIMSLQVLGQAAFAFRLSIAQILVSVLTCALLEAGIVLWRQRVVMWPASALLTGNGAAFILRVPGTRHGDWWSMRGAWIFAAAGAVGLLSKYAIRYRGRHVFNPSNFGLLLCFLILGESRAEPLSFWWAPTSTWLTLALVIIVAGGLVILSRLRMLGIAIGFWTAFALGIGLLAATGHSMTAPWHLGPITGSAFWWALVSSPEILVFLFFMITDPKTAPVGSRARAAYGAAVGLLAALLIAPLTTEFATKVAVLGALALVCAARPVLASMPWRLHLSGRRLTLGVLGGGAVYASVLAAAGLPARPAPTPTALASVGATGLPQVTVLPSQGVASQLDRATALRMAQALVADLRGQGEALRRHDLQRAAAVAGGDWLAELQDQVHQGKAGRPVVVATYRIRRLSLGLAPSASQTGPAILAHLEGTVERATYTGSPATLRHRSRATPVTQTLQLAPTSTGYLIVASAGGTSSLPQRVAFPAPQGRRSISVELLPSRGGSAPQGAPFGVRAVVRDADAASLPVDLGLSLVAPDGARVPFYESKLIVPGKGRATRLASVIPSQWFASLGSYGVAATVDGRPSGKSMAFTVTKPTVLAPSFIDVTTASGLATTVPAPRCGQFLNGAAWGDVNGDGLPDLFLTRLGEPAQLFVSDGHGRFRDEAGARGLAVTDAVGAAFADYDNDGHADLFVARQRGGSLLFHNDGTGHFTNVTGKAGIADGAPGAGVAWGDYNGDGYLDLYVTSYVSCVGKWTSPYALTAKVRYYPDRLYRNDDDGTFTDVTPLLGKGATQGAGFAATWFDYNGDNHADLYLGNDFIGQSPDHNHLWENRGGAFSDVSSASQTALFVNTMGIAVGDFNRDLRPDLALSNIGGNQLLRNDGNGTFTDVAASAGVARPLQRVTQQAVTWGVGAYDFNLDGWQDLYFAAGNVLQRNTSGTDQRNELFVNAGGGRRFLDLSAPSGAADPGDSKGAAFADYDRDGRMDVFVVDQGGAPRLFRNITPKGSNHWLEVDTQGTVSNRDGCGARLVLTLADGSRMAGEVPCSGNDKIVHFGLGTSTPARLDVTWPSGIRQELRGLAVDRLVRVKEPAR